MMQAVINLLLLDRLQKRTHSLDQRYVCFISFFRYYFLYVLVHISFPIDLGFLVIHIVGKLHVLCTVYGS
jgi:hypothetical protein